MTTKYINTKYTLLDRSKETIDGKTVLPLFLVMNELVDDFFMDVPYVECNMGLTHRITRDTGMVDSTNRSFDQGVKASKVNKQVVTEQIALLERRREIDEDKIDTLANPKEKLRQEDERHIRKLGEDVVFNMFNSVRTDGSENINGLFQRLDALNPTGLNNVISNGYTGGGSTTTSVLVVEWNIDETGGAHGLFPPGFIKNTMFGVAARDKGKEKVAQDATNFDAIYYAYVAQFKAWLGLAIANNRKIARLANVNPTAWDASNSFVDGGTENLINMLHNGRFNRERTRIYVNTTIAAQMDIYALNKTNTLWPTTEVFGRPVKVWQGIPIREMDTTIISNTQAVVA